MRVRDFILAWILLVLPLTGCSSNTKTSKHIEGPYYLDSTKYESLLSEPGGFEVHLCYKKDGETLLISKNPGGYTDTIYNNFSWRVYGSNLVFIEHDQGSYSTFRLVVFSGNKRTNTTVDADLRYWKIIADDTGITCHRYQNGEPKDDPNPKVFSADYLKSL